MPSRNSSQWQSTRKHSLGKLRRAHPASGATWNVQVVRGKMTSKCLWHACRALVLGMVLMLLGAGMATVGYYANQLSMGHEIRGNATVRIRNESRGFHLNNLSYVGPIVMGFGGFIVVAACVMTFEARDSAAKVVPARFKATGSNKSNVRNNNGSAITNRRANGFTQKTSRWDHHAGLFRTSPAEHPPQPPPLDRQALTAALIHFSKTIGNSPRLSPQQRRFSRSGSVPNLTSSSSLRTHLSPHRKQILFDQNLLSHRHLHHYQTSSHGRRLSKSRSSRISYSLVHRESSNSLLHPTLLQLQRQARSVDESGPYLRTATDSPRDSLTSVIVDNYEARLRDRTKRSDTAKRHILARQKPVEKEEPNSPKSILNDGRRRSSATSEASFASRLTNYRRISSTSRTPSIDSRSVQVELHSPDVDRNSPRTPLRRLTQSSTPSVEREFRSQLSICSEPITVRQLSGQSSLEPCVLEESPDFEEKESSITETKIETETLRNTSSTLVNRIKTIDNSNLQYMQQNQLPSIHSKKPRPNNLQLNQNQLLTKSNNNNDNINNNKNDSTNNDVKKVLQRSNSSRTFYRPKSKPLNDYDQIYFINSRATMNQDDMYDSLRVINERRSTILRASESNNSETEVQCSNVPSSSSSLIENSKISGKQVNITNVDNFNKYHENNENINRSELEIINNDEISKRKCLNDKENEENTSNLKNVNNDISIKMDCSEKQTENLDIEIEKDDHDNDKDDDNKKAETINNKISLSDCSIKPPKNESTE